MNTQRATEHYTTSFTVDQPSREVFDAINDPRRWWSEASRARPKGSGQCFTTTTRRCRCTIKISELVPGTKVVWHVLHNDFNFVKDKTEWVGTDVVIEIDRKGDATEVRFTHVGLAPAHDCYDVCSNAWGSYITRSLRDLITTGKGQPNPIEADLCSVQLLTASEDYAVVGAATGASTSCRTSIVPHRAVGIRAAMPVASSRSLASIRK